MNRINQVFANGKAFIPFITAGYPSIETTEHMIIRMAENGADLIELGIPFSDPTAEEQVIQDANIRALAGGVTVDKIFDMLKRVRKTCSVPIVFMMYANPVFAYDPDKFLSRCKEVRVDALFIPDLPFEEKEEFLPYCSKYDIFLISMVAPSSKDRIHMIAEGAQGFVYCVPSMEELSKDKELVCDVKEMVRLVKETQDIPCVVGLGNSSFEKAAEAAAFSDGVIVSGDMMNIVERYGKDCVPYAAEYVATMKKKIQSV